MTDAARGAQTGRAIRPRLVPSEVGIPETRQRVIARPRLDRLLRPARRSVTLVVANAGWGKTSAVRDWITRTHVRAAWITLDRSDDDPARFWSQVLDAINAVAPPVGGAAPVGPRERDGPADRFVRSIADDIAGLDDDLTLVLDDVHVLEDARVHDRLAYLVEHAPPHFAVVLVGREQPPLPVARWRARGMTAEVTDADLAFRADEAGALLASFDGLVLSEDDVADLTAQTEGWAMGLHLAALSLQRHASSDPALAMRIGVARAARFLVHEVVGREPRDVREFLYSTSVAENLNAALCNALTGRADAASMLRHIEHHRLFLVALDNRREWFRYHDLFREALVDELVARDEPRWRRLHAVAADWFAANGDIRRAVAHLLDAHDIAGAFELAVETPPGPQAIRDDDWIDLLPGEFVAADVRRMARLGVAMALRSRFADAAEWLRRAEAAQRDVGVAAGPDPELVAMRSELHALRGDATGAVALAADLLPFDFDRVTEGIVFERLPVNLARSLLVLGDVDAARVMVEPLVEHVDISDEARIVVVPGLLANVEVTEGRLGMALARATSVLQHAGHGWPNFGEMDARLARAVVFVERGDVRGAESELVELRALADELDSVLHGTFAELLTARLASSRDQHDRAVAHLALARGRAMQSSGDALLGRVDAVEAASSIRRGDLARAQRLTELLPSGAERSLLEIRLDLARGGSTARERLGELRVSNVRDQIVRQLLLARATTDPVAAQRHRRSAALLAEPEGFVLVFAEEDPAAPSPDAGTAATETLSERELDVLRRLTTPASNATIASELFISTNTLKTHVKSIYRKLGAGSREEAVETARARGLL